MLHKKKNTTAHKPKQQQPPIVDMNTCIIKERQYKQIKSLNDELFHRTKAAKEYPAEIEAEKNLLRRANLSLESLDNERRMESVGAMVEQREKAFQEFLPIHVAMMKECDENWDLYESKIKEFVSDEKNKGSLVGMEYADFLKNIANKTGEEYLDHRCLFYQAAKPFVDKIIANEHSSKKIHKVL